MRIKAFRGYRPGKDKVDKVASRPYDVLSTAEAREEAAGNPFSFLNIVQAGNNFSRRHGSLQPRCLPRGGGKFPGVT